MRREELHGMKSSFVKNYINEMMKKMQSVLSPLIYTSEQYKENTQKNANFPWGLEKDGINKLNDNIRAGIFLYQLECYVDVAIKNPDAIWVGDNLLPSTTNETKEFNGQIYNVHHNIHYHMNSDSDSESECD
jgi:hypothetical protein